MIMNRLSLIIIMVLLLIISILGFIAYGYTSRINSLQSFQSMYHTEHQKVLKFKDDAGYWRSKAEIAEVTKDNLQNIEELKNLPTEFRELKKNLKNLEGYSQVHTTTHILKTIKLSDSSVVSIDSIVSFQKTFAFQDNFEKITGKIIGDSLTINIKHRDSLEIIQYWDRKWLLGKKKRICEIKSNNPNTEISYQKSIIAKRKRGLF